VPEHIIFNQAIYLQPLKEDFEAAQKKALAIGAVGMAASIFGMGSLD